MLEGMFKEAFTSGKSFKIDLNGDTPLQTWYLENRRENHNKFYNIKLYKKVNWYVVKYYGRIGGRPTQTFEEHSTERSARIVIDKCIDTRISHGYELKEV